MVKLHENIVFSLSEGEPIRDVEKLSPEVETRMREIFPQSFADFLAEYGFCSFYDRGFQLCNPDDMRGILALIFGADKDLHHDDVHVFGYSAFGELYCWSNKLFDIKINLPDCMISCSALTYNYPVTASLDHIASGLIPEHEYLEFFDYQDEPMLDRCVEKYGRLEHGECYGFFPALAMFGGSDSPINTVDHIKRVKAPEHFAILAQLEQFNLAYSDGSEFKIVRPIG